MSAPLKRLVSFRSHNPDEDEASDLLVEDKRQKKEASCIEEELLNYTYNLVSKGREIYLNQAKLQVFECPNFSLEPLDKIGRFRLIVQPSSGLPG